MLKSDRLLVFGLESLLLRLVKSEKCESRYNFCKVYILKTNKKHDWDDHFEDKHNTDSVLYGQILLRFKCHSNINHFIRHCSRWKISGNF